MIEGKEVEIGGQIFTAAPLNFAALEKFAPLISRLSTMSVADIHLIRELIAASLRRNHPDLTDDYLLEWLDLRNTPGILISVLEASGVKQAEGESKPVAGNGQPAIGEKHTST